jgi:dTDP-4-amino-4,6-dideoxygalactose transaminase
LKITDMQAAVGLAQLESFDDFVATRRRNWQYLWNGLSDLQDIRMTTRRVLFTGATGFIGARIAERLRERGHALALLVRNMRRII